VRIFFYWLSAYLVFSFLYSKVIHSLLIVKLDMGVQKTFPDQSVILGLKLENQSILPTGYFWVEDQLRNLQVQGAYRALLSLPPRSSIRLEYQLWATDRGVFPLGPVRLESQDPGGLFPTLSHLGDRRELVVYPRPLALDLHRWHGLPTGDIEQVRLPWPDLYRLRNLRPFETGDSLRQVHAQVSANQGQLIAQVFKNTEDTPLLILLDFDKRFFPQKNRYMQGERLIRAASGLVQGALERNVNFGFVTNGNCPIKILDFMSGPSQGEMIYEMLGRLDWSEGQALDWFMDSVDFLSLPPSLTICYLGPPLTGDVAELLDFYRSKVKDLWVFSVGTQSQSNPYSGDFYSLEPEKEQR